MLEGQGGNITVAVGTDGIIMVDGQFAPLSDKIKAAIKAISPLPIKYLINTHYHGDHTGGNENFAKDGVTIVAHDNLRVRLAAGTIQGLTGNKIAPRPAEALPKQTYFGGSMTLEVGGRKAVLTHISNAHTDGDTWVYFPDANVLCTGDTSNNLKKYQNIDFANGGDVRGMIRAQDTYLKAGQRPDQDRGRPRPARQQGRHQRVPRDAGDLARPHQEAVRRGQERGRSPCRKAARRPRPDVGQQCRPRRRPHAQRLQFVQAVLMRCAARPRPPIKEPRIMRYDRRRRDLLSALTLAPLAALWRSSPAAAQSGPPPLTQPAEPTKAAFLARARELRDQAVREGDQAYGAVVVRDGVIVGEGRNYVVLHNDPTAHSELLAVRDAARRLGTRDLSQCDVYSTATPCAMCQGALYWGRVRRVFTESTVSRVLAPRLGC